MSATINKSMLDKIYANINNLAIKIKPSFETLQESLKPNINLFINFIICIFLFGMEILFIIGILIFNFTKDNTSIMGGLLVATYLLLFIFAIIKIITAFITTYNNSKKDTNTDIETHLYYSFHKLITTLPYDITFIILVSTIVSGFDSISNYSNIIRNMVMFVLSILVPVIILLCVIAFIGKKINKLSNLLFTPLFYIVFYLLIYSLLILAFTEIIKKTIFLNIFDNVKNYDVKKNDSTNIAKNLHKRFLIFKDDPKFDDESGYFYFVGIFLLIFLLIIQVFLIYAFRSKNAIVDGLVKNLIKLMNKLYDYFQIPKNKYERLKYQQGKYIDNLNNVNSKLLDQNGGKNNN
tara:strand:- start:327 stop:1376 length:1050 start_codon:yes stop_codon:yes gene_type:complete